MREGTNGEDEDAEVRVSKILSEMGACSRREADRYIIDGLVLVDGKVVTDLGSRARRSQNIVLHRSAIAKQNSLETVILNKPLGYVSHADDNGVYKVASSLITKDNYFGHGSNDRNLFSRRDTIPGAKKFFAPVGRLDIESTGLLVLTKDGRVPGLLIGETADVEKEYLVRIDGELTETGLNLLRHGLKLDGRPLKPAVVQWQNNNQLNITLVEGRNRQIRRMCALVGLNVLALKRVRIGKIVLGNLPLGHWRYLTNHQGLL